MPKQSRVPGAMRRRGSETPSTVAQPESKSRDARQVRWGENEIHTHAQDDGNMTTDQDGEGADDDDDDELDSMPVPTNVLAITAAKGVLGCCYIDIETNKLSFLEDQRDSSEWDLCSLSMPPRPLRPGSACLLVLPRPLLRIGPALIHEN